MSLTMASRIVHSSRTSICARGGALSHASRLQSKIPATRRVRGLASSAHGQESNSDTAWIIGSALVFGPAFIYLMGPRSTSSVTGHGDAHADPHPSKHGAAPAPITITDSVSQSNNTVEAEAEAKQKAVPEQGDDALSPESQKEDTPIESTSGVSTTLEGSEEGDASPDRKVDKTNAGEPSPDEIKDAIQQDVQSDSSKTAKVEEEQQSN